MESIIFDFLNNALILFIFQVKNLIWNVILTRYNYRNKGFSPNNWLVCLAYLDKIIFNHKIHQLVNM